MATLPAIKRITREDLKDAPEWINNLLYPLNLFLDTVYGALNNGITFRENIASQTESFSVLAGAASTDNTLSFSLKMKTKPQFLFCPHATTASGSHIPVTVTWNYDGMKVNITAITGLTNGTTYSLVALLI